MAGSMLMFKRPGNVRQVVSRSAAQGFTVGARRFSHCGAAAVLLVLGMSAVAHSSARGGAVCDALRANNGYQPVTATGPDFSDSALAMFRVHGNPEVRYASRPAVLEGAPEGNTIQYAYALDEDGGMELTVCFHSEAGPRFQAHTGPIRSSGGEHPVVSEVFVADADEDPAPELVMLVSWAVSNALGTSGRLYEPYAFDFPEKVGPVSFVSLDGYGLGSGLDGVLEGQPVEYPFKTEEAIRAALPTPGVSSSPAAKCLAGGTQDRVYSIAPLEGGVVSFEATGDQQSHWQCTAVSRSRTAPGSW